MKNVQRYKDYCRPKLTELLQALKLDREYASARGNYLYDVDGTGILDLVGGFGCSLLGHNHPEVVEVAVTALRKHVVVNAQGSIRGEAARLAEKLSDLTGADQGYCVNFSNSGAESVEAAIKHAYKVQFDKVRREYERITRILNDVYYKIERERLAVQLPGNNSDLIDFRDDLDEYNLAQFEDFQNHPVMVAFKGSFHGKTSSALKVTFNKSYREAFEGLSSLRPVYVDIHRPERIAEVLAEQVSTFYYPVLSDGRIELRPLSMTRVIAVILEVVLGEGGMRPQPEATLKYLAELNATRAVPLIVDEIQTGCGRTGAVYAYRDTPLAAIDPEYITLSKALGGGITKIGATLIRRDIYDADFSILHTSTFAEDDYSARIANKALEILTRNDGAMLATVKDRSNYLRARLNELKDKFPELIKEVRGKGLMLGVEFTSLSDKSPFFRASGKQGVLSLLVASYLLEYHHIRVLAPLTTMLKGNPGKQRLSILRIQPPGTVSPAELDRLIVALDEVLTVIRANNEYCLIGHLIGHPLSAALRRAPQEIAVQWPVVEEERHIDSRVGFVVHPTTLENLVDYYFPSFHDHDWSAQGLREWWLLISRFLEPVHVKRTYVHSNDFVIENNLVFVPYLPEYITQDKTPTLSRELQDKVQDAVTVARELGDDNIPITMVGLGAYTSIATQNGLSLNDYEVPVTTGNAYTTALTVQGIAHAADAQTLDLSQAAAAVVGATGNIGMVIAQIMSLNVGRVYLVGRPGARAMGRLGYVRQQCLLEIARAIRHELSSGSSLAQTQLTGVGARVLGRLRSASSRADTGLMALLAELEKSAPSADFGKRLAAALPTDFLGEILPLESDLAHLEVCEVIIIATNSSDRELIRPEMIKPGAIVCCTSVPSNLSARFEQGRGRHIVFDGGLARLPEDSHIDFVGMPAAGLSYGCMAETLLMGFDGRNHSFCKGTLTTDQVYHTIELARIHGFELGELKLNEHRVDISARLGMTA